MISSMHPWFIWSLNPLYYFAVLSIVLIFSSVLISNFFSYTSEKIVIIFTLLVIVFLGASGKNLNGYVGKFLTFFPFIILLGLKKEYHQKLLSFCTILLAIILLPSMFFYLISLFVELPSLGKISHPSNELYIFENYFFFVKFVAEGDFPRFFSIFLEPSYLATGGAFVLVANDFNFKKKSVWIILVSSLLSLSLAGIVIIVIGYVLVKNFHHKLFVRKLSSTLTLLVVIFSLYIFAINFRGGNNAVNRLIFERLQYDPDKLISGNNRFSSGADSAFEYLLSNDYLWTGLPENIFSLEFDGSSIAGAGYKIFILYNGLFVVIAYFIFYLLITLQAKNKYIAFVFLFLVVITFLQAAYPWSGSWIIPYILGISAYDQKKYKMENHNALNQIYLK